MIVKKKPLILNTIQNRTLRFIGMTICGILGLLILFIVVSEISMISHSFIDDEFNRMRLYEDLPSFPDYKIRGYRHRLGRSRYDYTLKLSHPISSNSIAKIDSLCNTYEGHLRWHYDEEKGQYTMFLWDIAEDFNDFLIITPGDKKVKFVYEPSSRLFTKKSYDLFYGPIYGEALFYERQNQIIKEED